MVCNIYRLLLRSPGDTDLDLCLRPPDRDLSLSYLSRLSLCLLLSTDLSLEEDLSLSYLSLLSCLFSTDLCLSYSLRLPFSSGLESLSSLIKKSLAFFLDLVLSSSELLTLFLLFFLFFLSFLFLRLFSSSLSELSLSLSEELLLLLSV